MKEFNSSEGKCNHKYCFRKAKRNNGVKVKRKYVFFCDEHIEQALEVAGR